MTVTFAERPSIRVDPVDKRNHGTAPVSGARLDRAGGLAGVRRGYLDRGAVECAFQSGATCTSPLATAAIADFFEVNHI